MRDKNRMFGIGIAIGLCLMCLFCSTANSYLLNFEYTGSADGPSALIAVAGLLLSVIFGLMTGYFIVSTILPKSKPTPKYQLVLYGLIPILFSAFFLATYYIILNIGGYLDRWY
jgi:hypothetical protein